MNSHVGSSTGQTSIVSGGATNIIGGQVIGKGVAIDAAELNIESLQDTATFKGKQQDISGQVTVGYGASASGSFSKSKINADYASVNEQSGILAGDDGYQINVKGNTDLKGGLITSTQLAQDQARNQLTTGTLTSSDIQNHADYEGSSFGISGSGGFNADLGLGNKAQAQSGATTKDQAGNTVLATGSGSLSGSKSIGFGSDSGHDKSTTYSGINTQNINIVDASGQQLTGKDAEAIIAQIQTSVTTDTAEQNSGHIGNNFDKDKVQKELDLQREVSQAFDQNRQELKKDLLKRADQLFIDAQEERRKNDGYDNEKSLALEQEANRLSQGVSYLDTALGAIWAGGSTDILLGQVAAQHADYAKNAGSHITAGQAYKIDCSGAAAQYYCKDGVGEESVKGIITGNPEDAIKKKEDAKWEGGAQEIFDLSELSGDKGNVIVSNPGIYNSKEDAFRNAVKQNPEAAKNGTLVVVLNNPSYEAIPLLSEVVFYAAYDKINDQLGAVLPLTNAEKKNVAINKYAQENYGTDKQILLEKSNHSRGGITESVSLQYSNKIGITNIPIELSRFYGTATNIDAYLSHVAKNGYVNKDGISTTVSGATHIVDFVGRPPLILGGNPATGGACIGCYSHSSYYGALPNEFLVDASNKNILDKNNNPIKNPEYDKYVKIWGGPKQGHDGKYINLSAPKIMLKDEEGNTRLIDQQGKTTVLNKKGEVIKDGFVTPIETDPNGNKYIEMDGKRYHANPY